MELNKGFKITCNKCGSENYYIDFVQDILWCDNCDNEENILGSGLAKD